MGRVYNNVVAEQTIASGNTDVFELMAGAANKYRFLGFELSSGATTSEALRLRLIRRTAAGSGGTAQTDDPARDEGDSTATAAFTRLVTTPGTAGAVLAEFYWDRIRPLVFLPSPQLQIVVRAGDGLGLEMLTAPTSVTLSCEVVWEEI